MSSNAGGGEPQARRSKSDIQEAIQNTVYSKYQVCTDCSAVHEDVIVD